MIRHFILRINCIKINVIINRGKKNNIVLMEKIINRKIRVIETK